MKRTRTRVDINLPELDRILEQERQAPLSEADYQKLRHALHMLIELLKPVRNTEKMVLVQTRQHPVVFWHAPSAHRRG